MGVEGEPGMDLSRHSDTTISVLSLKGLLQSNNTNKIWKMVISSRHAALVHFRLEGYLTQASLGKTYQKV